MVPSRTVVTVRIGRHMESGGGSEGAGDAGALGNKSEQSQLLSRPVLTAGIRGEATR